MAGLEGVLCESEEEGGLAHARVSDDNQFDEEVVGLLAPALCLHYNLF